MSPKCGRKCFQWWRVGLTKCHMAKPCLVCQRESSADCYSVVVSLHADAQPLVRHFSDLVLGRVYRDRHLQITYYFLCLMLLRRETGLPAGGRSKTAQQRQNRPALTENMRA